MLTALLSCYVGFQRIKQMVLTKYLILKVLKELPEIAPTLCHIFGPSLSTGIIPLDCKKATIVKISFQDRAKVKTILIYICTASKRMKYIVVTCMVNYFDKYNYLNPLIIKKLCDTAI